MDIRSKIIERSGFDEVFSADGDYNASDYNTIKENIQSKQYSKCYTFTLTEENGKCVRV